MPMSSEGNTRFVAVTKESSYCFYWLCFIHNTVKTHSMLAEEEKTGQRPSFFALIIPQITKLIICVNSNCLIIITFYRENKRCFIVFILYVSSIV